MNNPDFNQQQIEISTWYPLATSAFNLVFLNYIIQYISNLDCYCKETWQVLFSDKVILILKHLWRISATKSYQDTS